MNTRKVIRSILTEASEHQEVPDIGYAALTDRDLGLRFETGVPVELPYLRRTERAPAPCSDDQYLQKVEPAGRYMTLDTRPEESPELSTLEKGRVRFSSPLVISYNPTGDVSYKDPLNWKTRLSANYGNRQGRRLSQALLADGYDGIVIIMPGSTPYVSEIVDLSSFR